MSQATARARRAADDLVSGFRKQQSLFWVVAAGLLLVVLALRSCASIEPGQVAIRVNNLTGNIETVTRPGLIVRLPFGIHDVHLLDASPQTFHMRGDRDQNDLEVRQLTVRASDGSNFVFTDTTILYRVIPDRAQHVIRDSGQDLRYRAWMLPYSRSILRDEFGRESTISVSNPANFGEATDRARTRINELLNLHGLEVTSIVTPRPRFSDEYENLIESRNETENQLTVIQSELDRAATERGRRLAEVERDQNKVIQQKRAELEAALATAVTAQTQTQREVDTYKIDKVGAGQAALSAARRTAQELTGQLAAQYATKRAEIDAFRNQSVERVMERLGERLEGVTIEIQPWSRDATPSRIQYEQAVKP